MVSFPSMPTAASMASLLLLISSVAQPAMASPAIVPATVHDLEPRRTTSYASTCKDVSYYGYCRLEANCTTDGSTVGANKHAKYQHTFLDLGQCIKYEGKQLKWRYRSASHYESTYCAPCSQCTLDPKTTLMDCECQYTEAKQNHQTKLKLSTYIEGAKRNSADNR